MAGHSDTMRNDALNAVAANSGASYFGLHTADPGSSGANELSGGSYARVQAVPPAVSTVGTVTFPTAVINVPGGSTVKYWARYKTASGGTPYDSGILPSAVGGGPGDVYASPGVMNLALTLIQGA